MDLSLVFSALALALSGTSIAVQVVHWKRSGDVVRVRVAQSFLAYHGGGASDPMVMVTAHNAGRSPINVATWGIELPDGDGIFLPVQMPGASPLPHRLENGSSAQWWVSTAEVLHACGEKGVPHQRTRAFVRLADDRKVYADRMGIGLK